MSKRSIVHVEIPAKNREASAKFYADLFGWSFQHYGEPLNYTTFDTGNIGGGFPDIGENVTAGDVIVYLDSDDIEADLMRIEQAGGKTIYPKTEIPGFGWFATFSDPAGNTLALYTSLPR
jgi:predicted enzyme related to lactoylglutathione lyase